MDESSPSLLLLLFRRRRLLIPVSVNVSTISSPSSLAINTASAPFSCNTNALYSSLQLVFPYQINTILLFTFVERSLGFFKQPLLSEEFSNTTSVAGIDSNSKGLNDERADINVCCKDLGEAISTNASEELQLKPKQNESNNDNTQNNTKYNVFVVIAMKMFVVRYKFILKLNFLGFWFFLRLTVRYDIDGNQTKMSSN